jgi:hypothetical protein
MAPVRALDRRGDLRKEGVMSVKPILFSAPMIRALLDGRKTQTRRVLKPQPLPDGYYEGEVHCTNVPAGARFAATAVGGGAITTDFIEYPHRVGDVLWMREAWGRYFEDSPYPAYRADYTARDALVIGSGLLNGWRSPIHMPRKFSRLTLVVTDVRVQRVQEISEEDVLAEGVDPIDSVLKSFRAEVSGGGRTISSQERRTRVPAFRTLWDSINGPGAWAANPWVAAYTFTVHQQNVDAFLQEREAA